MSSENGFSLREICVLRFKRLSSLFHFTIRSSVTEKSHAENILVVVSSFWSPVRVSIDIRIFTTILLQSFSGIKRKFFQVEVSQEGSGVNKFAASFRMMECFQVTYVLLSCLTSDASLSSKVCYAHEEKRHVTHTMWHTMEWM